MIVIAANAGGAWSAIGDVTTTMLWIGKQITVWGVAQKVFLPAVVATLIPLFILSRKLKGNFACNINLSQQGKINTIQSIVLFAGLGLLLMVPLIKIVTHLPPFMGMMLALSLLWILSEIIHVKAKHSDDEKNSIFSALERIDMPSILFFLGILLAVSCLQSAGVLQDLAKSLQTFIGDNNLIVGLIGFASAIFDNVPLVAAVQGMYSLQEFPMGDSFWNLLAYCAGTGGSILIIGSAAGVAAMGMEQISFFGYVKNISLAALLGYIAGFVLCVLV
jgi:Na+/H+ antiporter NhaD/arsenite permease-like protein